MNKGVTIPLFQVDQELRGLLTQWYNLINKDHHKEKDCHFKLCQEVCAYNEKVEYHFTHDGYLTADFDWDGWGYFETPEEAIDNLKGFLRWALDEFKDHGEVDFHEI